jgi:hypothetical protein
VRAKAIAVVEEAVLGAAGGVNACAEEDAVGEDDGRDPAGQKGGGRDPAGRKGGGVRAGLTRRRVAALQRAGGE